MANTALDLSAQKTVPHSDQATITDANKWLIVTHPPTASKMSIKYKTNAGLLSTLVGLATDDAVSEAADNAINLTADVWYEFAIRRPQGLGGPATIAIASATGATGYELLYEGG